MRKQVALQSFGCRTNQQEIAVLSSQLTAMGYTVCDSPERADIVIVNTCCVTGHAESSSRRFIRSLARRRPQARVMVTGCLAQKDPGQFSAFETVDWVVGNTNKASAADLIERGVPGTFHDREGLDGSAPVRAFHPEIGGAEALRTRFPVKIQEGCDFACAYCIVPAVRGRSRSVSAKETVAACGRAVAAGFKELVLTGTHIGQYRDADCGGITGLVARIAAIDGDFRIRLSSFDPRDLDDALVSLLRTEGKVCRHLHVSVQSFSQPVLRAMGRETADAEGISARLRGLRESLPDLSLGVDLIAGFPGETDAMFGQTLDALERAGCTYGHVFRFSARPNTPAASMSGRVREEVGNARAALLRGQLERLNARFIESQTGRRHRIIVEKTAPVSGVSANYLNVVVPAATAARNAWLDVVVTGLNGKRVRSCTASLLEQADDD